MDAKTIRFGVSLVLVVLLAGLVAIAPNAWWALVVFVVVIPLVFASLVWASGEPVQPQQVVAGSVAMIAVVAAYLLLVVGLSRLIGPLAWILVPLVIAVVALVRRRTSRAAN